MNRKKRMEVCYSFLYDKYIKFRLYISFPGKGNFVQ